MKEIKNKRGNCWKAIKKISGKLLICLIVFRKKYILPANIKKFVYLENKDNKTALLSANSLFKKF